MCGKEFSREDKYEGFNFKHKFTFDSEDREGQTIEFDFCIVCSEIETKRLIRECIINPIT